jgi:F420-non-reducing hydrogenase small subunit
VVEVDYYLPGCPPVPRLLAIALRTLLSRQLTPKGTVPAPTTALCDECPRNDSNPSDLALTEFMRPHLAAGNPDLYFLAQGLVCMGPATRWGCKGRSARGSMPHTGCFGPPPQVKDLGTEILSALSSAIAPMNEESIDRTPATMPDPVGTVYRYAPPVSLLRQKIAP